MHYDILIVGGGMVGGSLASALAEQPFRIGVIEAVPPAEPGQPSYDDRVVALSLGSSRILDGIGVWRHIRELAVSIRHIHVSDRGHFGFTRMSAEEERVAALGYVVQARMLGPVLGERMMASERVDLISPSQLLDIHMAGDAVLAKVRMGDEHRTLSAGLLVAADGGRSLARQAVGISAREWAYGQTAVIANVTPGRPHGHVAYERFTDTGPLAVLPMAADRCSLVWTVTDDQADALLALDDAGFLERLQERFGDRLGRFQRVGQRSAYPLSLVRARQQAKDRIVVIGNAAHSLHPIAGQGFNLGLRDVAVLAQVLVDAQRAERDVGALSVLNDYVKWRLGDQRRITAFTDALVRVFSNRLRPLVVARNLGLLATDLLPAAKHNLARLAMGLAGKQPRLTRGLPL